MAEEKASFAALIISRRAEEFEDLRRQRERRLAERRQQRKIKREIDRRVEFVRRCRAAVEQKVRFSAGHKRSPCCCAVLLALDLAAAVLFAGCVV